MENWVNGMEKRLKKHQWMQGKKADIHAMKEDDGQGGKARQSNIRTTGIRQVAIEMLSRNKKIHVNSPEMKN